MLSTETPKVTSILGNVFRACLAVSVSLTCATAAADEPESFQLAFQPPTDPDSATTIPAADQALDPGSIVVDSVVVNNEFDLRDVVEQAREMVAKAREANPGMAPVEIMVVSQGDKSAGEGPAPEVVGKLIERAVGIGSVLFKVEATQKMIDMVKREEKDPYSVYAEQQIKSTRVQVARIRATTVFGLAFMGFVIAKKAFAVNAGSSAMAAAFTYKAQLDNENFKVWIEKSGSAGRVLKLGVYYFGYLTAMQWTVKGWGALHEYFTGIGAAVGEPGTLSHMLSTQGEMLASGTPTAAAAALSAGFGWFLATALNTLYSIGSEGSYVSIDAHKRGEALHRNYVLNIDDEVAGQLGAVKAFRFSQWQAVTVAAISTFTAVLMTARPEAVVEFKGYGVNAGQALNLVFGFAGTTYYVMKCTKFTTLAKSFIQKFKRKFKSAAASCSSLFAG